MKFYFSRAINMNFCGRSCVHVLANQTTGIIPKIVTPNMPEGVAPFQPITSSNERQLYNNNICIRSIHKSPCDCYRRL